MAGCLPAQVCWENALLEGLLESNSIPLVALLSCPGVLVSTSCPCLCWKWLLYLRWPLLDEIRQWRFLVPFEFPISGELERTFKLQICGYFS